MDYRRASLCFPYYPSKFSAFCQSIIPNFFKVISYNDFNGIYLLVTCFLSTIYWNFIDVFIIIVCYTLYKKFQMLNDKVSRNLNRVITFLFKGTKCNITFPFSLWITAQRSTILVQNAIKLHKIALDCGEFGWHLLEHHHHFLYEQLLLHLHTNLVSFYVRFYGIHKIYLFILDLCKFLMFFHFYSPRRPEVSYMQSIYFWFSMSFLMLRTSTVCLTAAMIYHESKQTSNILRQIPSEYFCSEVSVKHKLLWIKYKFWCRRFSIIFASKI